MGQRLVGIEANTGLPLAGKSLARLRGQLATYAKPANLAHISTNGSAAETIVVTMKAAHTLDATFLIIERQLAAGTLSGVIQGSNMLIQGRVRGTAALWPVAAQVSRPVVRKSRT